MAETFGALLRRYRKRAMLTVSAMAESLGASRASIAAWEAGQRVPRDRARLKDMAQVLQLAPVEAEQLITAALRQRYCPNDAGPPQPVGATSADSVIAAALPATPNTATNGTVIPLARPAKAIRYRSRPPIADFVGRENALEQLCSDLQAAVQQRHGAVISGVRGMGGIGKTELAYMAAHHLSETFPDVQIFLHLRGTSADPLLAEQALQTVIHAFTSDAQLPSDLEGLQALYQAALHGQRVLILADDAYDAAQVRPLLPPLGCALLVTSRQRFTLPGMVRVDLEQFTEVEAVTLLRTICPRLSVVEAQAIGRACGYLPLALRVSGSILHNTSALNVAAYLQHLADERQRLMHLRDPDDPELDVASALALSYVQLDAAAQRVFRQLGVFVADFATDLALTVVDPPAGVTVETTLHLLLRRNLVMYDAADGRWHLHDLVRDLARSYLETAGEYEAVMWRYAQAAVQIAQATQAQYRAGGDDILAALARFDAERLHIDEAQRWGTARAGAVAGDTLLVADALATYDIGNLRYDTRQELLPQLIAAVAAARRLGDQWHIGQLLARLGRTYVELGTPHQVRHYAQQALTIAQTIGDRRSEQRALTNLAIAHAQLGVFRQAIPYLKQALTIAQEQGDLIATTGYLADLGHVYGEIGMFRHALHYLEQARIVHQQQGSQLTECVILEVLGRVYVALGDAQRAIAILERGLTQTRAIRYHPGEGTLLSILGQAYAIGGDQEHAVRTFAAALAILQEVGNRWQEAECAWHFGLFLAQQGDLSRALPLLRAALAYEQEIGHARGAQHAALLARLEAGEVMPAEPLNLAGQCAVGEDQDEFIDDDLLP